MGKLYWLLNLGLLVLAGIATMRVINDNPKVRWGGYSARVLAPEKAGFGTVPPQRRVVPSMPEGISPEDSDELWQKTLFRPERTEETAAAGEKKDQDDPEAFELELVGIGIIGSESAAIILEKRNRRSARRSSRRRTPTTPAKKNAPKERTQHVYRIDDVVGDTGYKVKEIKFDEVMLVRGDEERILKLESGDTASEARRTTAVKSEAKAAAKDGTRTVKAGGTSQMPPPPPPPPPIAGGGGLPPNVSTKRAAAEKASSNADLIRKARLAREKLQAAKKRDLEIRRRALERSRKKK